MDEVLNVSSSVTGALSLAIQIAQLTQKHTSRMVNLPHSVTLYIAELVSLKSLLSDVQDAFLLQSTASGPGAAMHQTLATELEDIRAELESLHCKLQDAQSHRALLMVKNLVWPFGDDETVGWANSLNRCKDRVQTTVLVSGLRLQLQTLRELRQLRDKAASAEQDRENRLILDWICDDAWRQKHSELAQAHHPNTGEWILDRPEFRDWVDGNQRTLWCYGAPGAGKTQLMSFIIDRLPKHGKVCYFYCDYHSSDDKSVTTDIAAAILRQLVEDEVYMPEAVKALYRSLHNGRRRLKLDDIISSIGRICKSQSRIFVVVDAVDECGSQRKAVLQLLEKISNASISILISSRPHVSEIKSVFGSYIQLEIKAPPSDIRTFTESVIASNSELSELIQDSKEDIVQQITNQSAGVFLISALQCTHLTHLSRLSEIRKAVQCVPSGLDDLYKESMLRIELQPREKRSIAIKSLSWIFHSKRELSVEELVHALAISPDEAVPMYEDVVPRKVVLDVCAGLVMIDATNDTFRFVHHTLHEYFQATHQNWFPGAQLDITRACLAYLRLMSPERGLAASIIDHPFLKYAATQWGNHVRNEYNGDLDCMALAALGNEPQIEMMASLLESEQADIKSACMFPSPNLAIQLSARLGALPVLKLLSEHGHSLEGADSSGRTALHWAARGGFADVVQFLLQKGVVAGSKTNNGMTPLHWAAKHGHASVVGYLLLYTDSVEPTLDGRTALHWASSRGHISVVRILLSDKKLVDVEHQSRLGWTALHWAACSGKRTIVMCGVEQSTQSTRPSTATPSEAFSMSGGESKGHEEVVRLLLESEANPNSQNKEQRTALHWAAASGNAAIIRLLLENGANAKIRDAYDLTPLQFAIQNGVDGETVRALLS